MHSPYRLIAVLVALLLLPTSASADEVRKAFELADGSVVVGVVLDEGESGYLVRTVEGETIRVPYDQVETVTVLGGETPAATVESPVGDDEEDERSGAAGVRYHLSEGAAVASGVLFGAGLGTVGVGAAFALETGDELPGTPIAIGGVCMVVTSTILLGASNDHARSAARLYGIDFRGPQGVVIGGISTTALGLMLGVAAIPEAIVGSEDTALGLAIGSISLGLTGHILAQAGAGRLRSLVAEARDADEYGTASAGPRRPSIQFVRIWAHRTPETTVVGAGFIF